MLGPNHPGELHEAIPVGGLLRMLRVFTEYELASFVEPPRRPTAVDCAARRLGSWSMYAGEHP